MSDYGLGNEHGIHFRARPRGSTNWSELNVQGGGALSIGALPDNIHVLAAGEEMLWSGTRRMECSVWLSPVFCEWAASLGAHVEIVIEQELGYMSPDDTWHGKLISPVLSISRNELHIPEPTTRPN